MADCMIVTASQAEAQSRIRLQLKRLCRQITAMLAVNQGFVALLLAANGETVTGLGRVCVP